jgi:hypothetical protein
MQPDYQRCPLIPARTNIQGHFTHNKTMYSPDTQRHISQPCVLQETSINLKSVMLPCCRLSILKTRATKILILSWTLLAHLLPFLFLIMATFFHASVTLKRWIIRWLFQWLHRKCICKHVNVVIVELPKCWAQVAPVMVISKNSRNCYLRHSWGSNSKIFEILLVLMHIIKYNIYKSSKPYLVAWNMCNFRTA